MLLRHHLELAGFQMRQIEVFDRWLYDVVAEKVRHFDGAPVVDSREARERTEAAEFVTNCYRQILKREPDADGFEGFVEALASNTISRDGVIQEMLGSEEYRARRGSA